MLEPHEIQAAMAFLPDYEDLGNKRERVRQLGNAVTPPAARDLVAAVAEALTGEPVAIDRTMRLILDSDFARLSWPVGGPRQSATAASFPSLPARPAESEGRASQIAGRDGLVEVRDPREAPTLARQLARTARPGR